MLLGFYIFKIYRLSLCPNVLKKDARPMTARTNTIILEVCAICAEGVTVVPVSGTVNRTLVGDAVKILLKRWWPLLPYSKCSQTQDFSLKVR